IRLLDDGRVLMHDFGGDSVESILDSMGLDWSALFPEQTEPRSKPDRRAFPAMDVLRCIRFEAIVVLCAAAAVRDGTPLPRVDYDRLGVAVDRLQCAVDLAGGARHG